MGTLSFPHVRRVGDCGVFHTCRFLSSDLYRSFFLRALVFRSGLSVSLRGIPLPSEPHILGVVSELGVEGHKSFIINFHFVDSWCKGFLHLLILEPLHSINLVYLSSCLTIVLTLKTSEFHFGGGVGLCLFLITVFSEFKLGGCIYRLISLHEVDRDQQNVSFLTLEVKMIQLS